MNARCNLEIGQESSAPQIQNANRIVQVAARMSSLYEFFNFTRKSLTSRIDLSQLIGFMASHKLA